MDAAERLFLERGVSATSIDDIVVTADVAKGTFYLYFASKEKLLAALLERYVSTQCEKLAAAMDRRPRDDWGGVCTPGWPQQYAIISIELRSTMRSPTSLRFTSGIPRAAIPSSRS